jgi:hypothetical protein
MSNQASFTVATMRSARFRYHPQQIEIAVGIARGIVRLRFSID